MSNAITQHAEELPAANQAADNTESFAQALMRTVQTAVMQGDIPVEKLERIIALQERREAQEAERAFHRAMGAFRENPPQIRKNARVDYRNKQGGRTTYEHVTLDELVDKVGPALAAHGIYWNWKTRQLDGGLIEVTCRLRHVMGHVEESTLYGRPDDSGQKNSLQAIGSAQTYLQRYTLFNVLGLAAGNDDDGNGAGAAEKEQAIQADQVSWLRKLMTNTETEEASFVSYLQQQGYQVESVDELDQGGYQFAQKRLLAKQRRMQASEGEQ